MDKKLKFGILSLLTILLFGFSNDDENIQMEKSINGTWKLKEIYQSDCGSDSQ